MNYLYKFLFYISVSIFIIFSVSNSTAQDSVVLIPAKDNTLYESETGTSSNGAGSYIFAGRTAAKNGEGLIRRALLKFDIAENIPTGSAIDSVKLTLNMLKTTAGAVNITLHRLLHDWGEGSSNAPSNEGGGTDATAGDATWDYAFYDTSQWDQSGGDFDDLSLATQSVSGVGSYTWGPNEELRQNVQSWLGDPSMNYGWIIRGDESTVATAKRFGSKENATASNRPQLTVYYTPPLAAISVRDDDIPKSFALEQNHPNPFNPTTQINFDIAEAGNVNVTVYNLLGQKVKILFSGYLIPNSYVLEWDGRNSIQQDVPTGFYFYVLHSEHLTASKKMLLIR